MLVGLEERGHFPLAEIEGGENAAVQVLQGRRSGR